MIPSGAARSDTGAPARRWRVRQSPPRASERLRSGSPPYCGLVPESAANLAGRVRMGGGAATSAGSVAHTASNGMANRVQRRDDHSSGRARVDMAPRWRRDSRPADSPTERGTGRTRGTAKRCCRPRSSYEIHNGHAQTLRHNSRVASGRNLADWCEFDAVAEVRRDPTPVG